MKQYYSSIRVASVLAALALSALTVSAQAPGGGAAPAAGGGGARGGGGGGGGGRGGPAIPGITAEQTAKINELFTTGLQAETAAVTAARADLATATFLEKRDDNAIKAAVAKVQAAELALANKRAAAFTTLQGSAEKLNPEQVTAFVAAGGTLGGGGGAAPATPPMTRFRAGMRPDEIVGAFEGMFTRDGSAFVLAKLEPWAFAGGKGFRFEYTFTRKVDGAQLRGLGYGVVDRDTLFAMV